METKKTIKWNRQSYDALFAWVSGGAAQRLAESVLIRNGGEKIVRELKTAPNLGVWYDMTRIAAKAVGDQVVASSAESAEKELEKLI